MAHPMPYFVRFLCSTLMRAQKFMYVIILEKALAYLVCAGVMRAISVKWHFESHKKRVFIYAVETDKTLASFPLEWQMLVHNQQVFGNIPHFVDQVSSAIIGYVDVYRSESQIPPLWNVGEDLCMVYNSHFLDDPIYCDVKEEGFIQDMPCDFTAYEIMEQRLSDVVGTLFLPLGVRFFEQSSRRTIIDIDLFGEAANCLLTKDHKLKEFNSITVHYGNKCREFEFSKENRLQPSLDLKGNLKLFPSILKGGEKVARTSAIIYLENELEY